MKATLTVNNPLALAALRDSPQPTLEESLTRARRLVSPRVGMISQAIFADNAAEDLPVYQARSRPADVQAWAGQPALNSGAAGALDPNRALMKAVGESIERYCSALYDEDAFRYGTYEDLDTDAVHPQDFAIFSESEFVKPRTPYAPLNAQTPLAWVEGYALGADRPQYVPAAFIYCPYFPAPRSAPREPNVWTPISTGLACSHNFATAVYKGILETLERDAFMIVWQNQLPRPQIDLSHVSDPYIQRQLRAFEKVPVRVNAYLLTLDIPVSIVLVVLSGLSNHPPYTLIGVGIDLSPRRALSLALEESFLDFWGMSRRLMQNPDYRPAPDFMDVTTLNYHGLAHALIPEMRDSLAFLTASDAMLALEDLPDPSSPSSVANVHTLVEYLAAQDLEVLAVDLTTPDIDELGFKVVRAVVPGLQPLDDNHAHQYLGGKRLYEVPWRLGLVSQPRTESELNPYPHPFP